jgi:hypothetical protein
MIVDTNTTPAIGSIRKADATGEYPCTDCKYWLIKNIDPIKANAVKIIARLAPVKDMFLKKLSGNMGVSHRFSHQVKPPRTTVAIPRQVRTVLSV